MGRLVGRIERLEYVAGEADDIAHWSDERLIRRSIALHWNLANELGKDPELLGVVQSAAAAYGVEIESLTVDDLEPRAPAFADEVSRFDGMSEADLISYLTAQMREFASRVEFFRECSSRVTGPSPIASMVRQRDHGLKAGSRRRR